MSRLEEIKSRLAAATPGPWERYNGGVFSEVTENSQEGGVLFNGIEVCVSGAWDNLDRTEDQERQGEIDLELIAHAPQDLADLIKIVELYEKALEKIAVAEGYASTAVHRCKTTAQASLSEAKKVMG